MATRILDLPQYVATIEVFNNEDFADALAYYDASGAPISLEGIALSAVLRSSATSEARYLVVQTPEAPLPVGVAGGAIVTGGVDGNVMAFAVPADVMLRVPAGVYVFDVVASADTRKRVVLVGTITVKQGVTR